MEQKRIMRIVVASPGDVQAERDTVPAVIDELNRGMAAERDLRLELYRWEADAYPGFHPAGPQGLIDPILRIEDCDILIGIFWKRFGTPTTDAQSGTEHEILCAFEAWRRNHRPHIMVYFNQQEYELKSNEETDQREQVLNFKRRFPKEGLWWEYKGETQFERLVRNHLTQFIRSQFPRQASAEAGAAQDAEGRSADELTKDYLANLAERVGTIYLFGEEESRPLDKMFVELSIVEEYWRPVMHAEFLGLMDAKMRQRRSAFARAEEEHEPNAPGNVGGKVKHTVRPDELLRVRTKAVVAGAPGCGKTTLLRYLAWRTLEASERLPVFLELKTVTEDAFTRAEHDLDELLFTEAVARPLDLHGAEYERLRAAFRARLAAGEVAIFLDGLDEVSGTDFFPRLCAAVIEFTRGVYRDNTLVMTSRPYALPARLEGLKKMEIAPLNQRQTEEFIAHYYGSAPDAQQLLRTLRQRRALRELLRVPFLLTVVTQLYRQEHQIVEDRLELYRLIVWQLVVQFDREKQLVRRSFLIPDRTGALKLDFLKHLACKRLLMDDARADTEKREAARLVFTSEVMLEEAQRFWESAGRPPYTPHDLADDAKATPLLREVGAGVYAFTHLTLQEYLAATELAQRDDCEEVFCRAYFNPTLASMEVLPMTLGLVSHPERLYAALEQLPDSLTFTGLRLRARGLAYVKNLDLQVLTRLADRLRLSVRKRSTEEFPFEEIIVRSFSEARTEYLQVLADSLVEHVLDCYQREVNSRYSGVDTYEWQYAAIALGKFGDERVIDALLWLVKEASWYGLVCERAADVLGELGSDRAVDGLLLAVEQEYGLVGARASLALGQIGGARVISEALRMMLNDQLQNRFRLRPCYILREIGGVRVVDELVLLLKDKDSMVRKYAIIALGLIGSEYAIEKLLPLLEDENNDMRLWAAVELAELGDEHALDELLNASLKDVDSWGRQGAISALVKLGGERAIIALLPLLKDEDKDLRLWAAKGLVELGDKRALNEIFPLLKNGALAVEGFLLSEERERRERVIGALAELGDERAVDELIPLLKDEDLRIRADAIVALGRIGSERAIPALLPLLDSEHLGKGSIDRELCSKAALALGRIGSERAVDALVNVLRSENEKWCDIYPSEDVRPQVMFALGQIGDERAVAALLPMLSIWRRVSPDKPHVKGAYYLRVRKSAAESLGQMDESALGVKLVRALAHEDEIVRGMAAQAVGYYVADEQVLHELARLAAESIWGGNSEESATHSRYIRKLKYFGIEPVITVERPQAQAFWLLRPLIKAYQAVRDRAKR
jgi:HEAT repeat protein